MLIHSLLLGVSLLPTVHSHRDDLKVLLVDHGGQENRSSFSEITLPSAVMRFRQGVGRLIRSKTDVGGIVILDSRILHKIYGKDFITELPMQSFETTCLLDLIGC